MNLEISISEQFGTHLADGDRAAAFRMSRIDPYVELCAEIVLDFTGVRNANSSFINALVSGLVEQHGIKVLNVLVFKACNPSIRVLIESAIELGASKHDERQTA